jgi:hypothetical protein
MSPTFCETSPDNDPEDITSQSFQEMLQTPKEIWHNGVTRNAPNSQVIDLKHCFYKQVDKRRMEGRKKPTFWEEIISYFPLIRYGQHRKRKN